MGQAIRYSGCDLSICGNSHCIVKESMEIMVVHIGKCPMDNCLCCERREMDHNVIKKGIKVEAPITNAPHKAVSFFLKIPSPTFFILECKCRIVVHGNPFRKGVHIT